MIMTPSSQALLRTLASSAAALSALLTPQKSDTKESRLGDQQGSAPLAQKHRWWARRAAMGVGTRVFYESIFSSDSVVTSPTFAASSPHSSLCCWQSHMVTSHLPEGPLPRALPGPEGAVQGFHLCAGCRTGGTWRISPLPPG